MFRSEWPSSSNSANSFAQVDFSVSTKVFPSFDGSSNRLCNGVVCTETSTNYYINYSTLQGLGNGMNCKVFICNMCGSMSKLPGPPSRFLLDRCTKSTPWVGPGLLYRHDPASDTCLRASQCSNILTRFEYQEWIICFHASQFGTESTMRLLFQSPHEHPVCDGWLIHVDPSQSYESHGRTVDCLAVTPRHSLCSIPRLQKSQLGSSNTQ